MKRLLSPFVVALLLAAVSPAQIITHLWVDAINGSDTQPGTRALPLQSITAAVALGQFDTTIHVLPGTYSPTLTGEVFTTTFTSSHLNVRLIGTDPTTCILDFEQSVSNNNGWYFLIDNGATNIEIANLHMKNGAFQPAVAWYSAAIWWRSVDGLNIHNCIIEGCESGFYSADGAKNVTVHDNIFDGCNIPIRLRQDAAQGAQNVVVYNNLLINSTGYYSDTLSMSADDPGQMVVNNIVMNNPGDGIAGGNVPVGVVVENNNCFNNGGIAYNIASVPPSNLSVDPMMVNAAAGDYHLMAGSPMIEAGYVQNLPLVVNDFYGNARGSDYDSDMVVIPDIGVHEVPGVSLSVQNFGQGQLATFTATPQQAQVSVAILFISLTPVTGIYDPIGSVGLLPETPLYLGALPGSLPIPIPVSPFLDNVTFYAQALALGPNGSLRTSGRLDLTL